MIVFIYTADQEVPFEGFYQALGSYKEVIFSNVKERFDEKTLETLLKDIDIKDETAIFYVPSKMKEKFKQPLENKFPGTKLDERKPTPEEKSSKGGIDSLIGIGWDALSRFIKEKMEIMRIIEPNKECVNLLNDIVSRKDSIIDAIFIYDVKNKYLCKTKGFDEIGQSKIDSEQFAKFLGSLLRTDDALEDYGILFINGVFISSYLVKNTSNFPIAISFITVKEEIPLARFNFFCNQHLKEIKLKCQEFDV